MTNEFTHPVPFDRLKLTLRNDATKIVKKTKAKKGDRPICPQPSRCGHRCAVPSSLGSELNLHALLVW